MREGLYRLAEPLKFGPEDSGTQGAPVVWRAYGKESVTLAGSLPVTGFSPWRDRILVADLHGTPLEKVVSRQLFSNQGLQYAALMTMLVAVAGGFIFRAFEKSSQHMSEWDGIFWALTTMTTLGSQYEPHTLGSQLTTIGVLLVGVSFMAMLTGAIAQRFLNPLTTSEQPDEQLQLSVESAPEQ